MTVYEAQPDEIFKKIIDKKIENDMPFELENRIEVIHNRILFQTKELLDSVPKVKSQESRVLKSSGNSIKVIQTKEMN